MPGLPTDLNALSVRRSSGFTPALRPPRRWFSRVFLPLGLLVGFAALVGWASRDFILPATPITVTPVIAKKGIVQATGVELFSATGWIEPRPTPIEVPALTEGVVEDLLVLPGQSVLKGQIVARLIHEDCQLGLDAAEEELAERRSKVESADADVLEATAQVRAADVTARAEEELFKNNATGKVRYEQALAQQAMARAKLKQAEARRKEAEARVRQGEVAVRTAQLKVDRMTVRAPASGVVMQVNTVPGRMVGVRSLNAGAMDSLITLYDPNSLQVRVEVPIDKFHLVRPGQPAAVEVDVIAGERLLGTVLYDTHETDINRNTVRVKVGLIHPPSGTFAWPWPLPGPGHLAVQGALQALHQAALEVRGPLKKLRPGMIAKVHIISPATETKETGGEVLRLMIPKRLLIKNGNQSQVWIVNQIEGHATLVNLVPGSGQQGELVEIAEGLQPSDKLVVSGREALKPGQRVKITGEE
jgi:HlyD family secretion protein